MVAAYSSMNLGVAQSLAQMVSDPNFTLCRIHKIMPTTTNVNSGISPMCRVQMPNGSASYERRLLPEMTNALNLAQATTALRDR